VSRILLLGGGGFIGRNLREALHDAELVISADPGLESHMQSPGRLDCAIPLSQFQKLVELIQAHRISVVVHLASTLLPSSGEAALHREFDEIILPTYRLVDHCAARGIRFVFFSSGGTIYGDAGAGRVEESQALAPKSCYGFAKLLLEEYLQFACRVRGLSYLVLRPSNPYGRHQRLQGAQGLVAVALGKLRSSQPLEVWGDGSAIRDYLDVRDLCLAAASLIRLGVTNRAINIGSGVGHSITDVLETIRLVTGQKVSVVHRPARGVDVRAIVLDTQCLASLIEWRPRGLEQGIRDFHGLLQEDRRG
jgi:UDP-glucose 4-epimerase